MTAGQGCANLPLQDLGDGLVGSPQVQIIIHAGSNLAVPAQHLLGEGHAEQEACPHPHHREDENSPF